MKDFKEFMVKQCLELLNRKDIKEEIKDFIRPMINLVVQELYPYMFICVVFSIVSFLMTLCIFIILLKNNK